MKQKLLPLVAFSFLLSTQSLVAMEDSHGAVHIVLPDGEEEVDDGCDPFLGDNEECLRDERPWYQNQKFEVIDDHGDPTGEVEDDTEWPGEREEFSDQLFRQ